MLCNPTPNSSVPEAQESIKQHTGQRPPGWWSSIGLAGITLLPLLIFFFWNSTSFCTAKTIRLQTLSFININQTLKFQILRSLSCISPGITNLVEQNVLMEMHINKPFLVNFACCMFNIFASPFTLLKWIFTLSKTVRRFCFKTHAQFSQSTILHKQFPYFHFSALKTKRNFEALYLFISLTVGCNLLVLQNTSCPLPDT